MIELIFSDSGAASLILAKETGDKSGIVSMESGVNTADGTETMRDMPVPEYRGVKLPGDVSDIAAIWLIADMGDIAALSDCKSRLEIMREISDAYEMESDNWVETESVRMAQLISRLETAAESGEDVRIWWSDTADEVCGFYWAVNIFERSKGRVTGVKVPVFLQHDSIKGTGGLTPGDFVKLPEYEREIVPAARRVIAEHWQRLVKENAPLRAVINGLPCSVAEDFYDSALFSAMPEGEFTVATAIGFALVHGPPGLHAWWYARRIRHFLDNGILKMTKKHDKLYYSTIERCSI